MDTSLPMHRTRRAVRHRLALGRTVAAALLWLAGCGPAPTPSDAPMRPGEWLEFHGSWNASGLRQKLPFDGERRAALVDLKGTLLLSGPSRPGAGFRGEIIALTDNASGLVGRAVWTDEHGDQVFSELRGEGTATRNRITGTFVEGTGRYAGASGSYEFSWQYFLNADDGVIQGRAEGLKGRVRMDRRAAAPQHAEPAASAPRPPGSTP